jgi:hypothetical protein
MSHDSMVTTVELTCYVPMRQRVQLQLKKSEKADKDDASPVTIADYGEHSNQSARRSMWMCPQQQWRSSNGTTLYTSSLTTMLLHGCIAGAQALVAWSLQQAFPDAPLQMVAEEDAADLRCASDGSVIWIHRHWNAAG